MAIKRIIKDYDNLGQRCKFAVQEYDGAKKEWIFSEYTDIIDVMGECYECPPMPKWYNTWEEAHSKINHYDKEEKEVILGIDDKD